MVRAKTAPTQVETGVQALEPLIGLTTWPRAPPRLAHILFTSRLRILPPATHQPDSHPIPYLYICDQLPLLVRISPLI
jgi:hypothetical protein